MEAFDKVVRLGVNDCGSVYCKVEYSADGRLSITGVEGPMENGDAKGGCGQIVMSLRAESINPAPGWTTETIDQFLKLWDRWHLNDMRAGSTAQEQWLRDNPIAREDYAYPKSYYEVAGGRLSAAGLNPDSDGYQYGHAWKTEVVPDDVLQWLKALPDTDKEPAWV